MDHDMSYIAEVAPIKSSTPLTAVPITSFIPWVAPVRIDTDNMPLLDTAALPTGIFWKVLGQALTMRRDYGSATESAFVAWLAKLLGATMVDAAGNVHVDTRFDPSHRTLFTAHTDTVHSAGGINEVRVDGKFWRAGKGAALGADDGSGCALLAYLIDCGVPGYYVFFRGEERGGVGSKWLADNMPEMFKGEFDRAVAFDRAGYYDVITHQAGGRCCSDEFADALSEKLSTDSSWYVPCNGGVYTDTAEFVNLIPECTNISVGYKNQHGDREEQDIEFLWELAKIIVTVEWDKLPTKRDPNAKPAPTKYGKWSSKGNRWYSVDDDDIDYSAYWDNITPVVKDVTTTKPAGPVPLSHDDLGDEEQTVLDAIEAFCTGDRLWLLDLIADAVYPEDPSLALRCMNAKNIDERVLEMAESMIWEGWSANATLCELYEWASDV